MAISEGIEIKEDRLKRLIRHRAILPISSGKGRNGSRFSEDALARLRLLHQEGLDQQGEISDIRWTLWVAGFADQWKFVREILLRNLRRVFGQASRISRTELRKQLQDFSRIRAESAEQRDPFSGIEKMVGTDREGFDQAIREAAPYLAKGFLWQSPYSFDTETSPAAKSFEDLVGTDNFELHEQFAAAGIADIGSLRSILEDLKDSDAARLADHFGRAEKKPSYREAIANIGATPSTTGKKPHDQDAIWTTRAVIACLLAAKMKLEYLQAKQLRGSESNEG